MHGLDERYALVAAIQEEVTKQQQESESDLAKAEPALMAANAALNTLNRVMDLKSVVLYDNLLHYKS
ncbi:hypothetical protein NDU88_004926 [Pleurodeles waltl]|uniref:Dynein heavy chain coiled coil stalk domain-containing protein n=1 Tax=Pleurodeles waltl TaxID=8319 RepID=A0AAV7UKM4_PLEWA|nr:hypothetical protein NDU88_004926 [Pleurodeles waltl]